MKPAKSFYPSRTAREEYKRSKKEDRLMKLCPKCQTKNQQSSNFCKKCGGKISGSDFQSKKEKDDGRWTKNKRDERSVPRHSEAVVSRPS